MASLPAAFRDWAVSYSIFSTFIFPPCLHFSSSQSLLPLPPPLHHACLGSSTDPVLSSAPLWNIDNSPSVLYVVNQQTSPITIHSNQTHRVCWRACMRVRSLQHTIRCNEGMWQWTEFRRTLLVGPRWPSLPSQLGGPEEHNHVGINISHALVPDRLTTLLLTQL